jgi:hypothetical protein
MPVKRWVHIRTDMLIVVCRQQAPVQVWFQMMGAMIAIIKQEKIQRFIGKVPGMVILVLLITAIMLEVVGPHDTPGSILMRDDPKE